MSYVFITLQITFSPFSARYPYPDRKDGLCSVSPTLRGMLLRKCQHDLLFSPQSEFSGQLKAKVSHPPFRVLAHMLVDE